MSQPKMHSLLIFSDAHIPNHSTKAWALMLQVGRWLKPDVIVSNGDLADCFNVSAHSKPPDRVNRLEDEIAAVNVGLDQLDALGAKQKWFNAGNHCSRITRYLQDKAPELFGIVDIPTLFHLPERKWIYTPYRQHIRLGKLYVTHDVGVAGRYSTYKALDLFQHSVATGHAHRLSYVVEGDALGSYKLSAQFGWLGDADKVDYMTRANVYKNWALGFGIGYLHPKTGIAYLTPVPLIKSGKRLTCMVGGRYFEQ